MMQGFAHILFLWLLGLFLFGHPAQTQAQEPPKDTLTAAIHATWAQDWSRARALAKEGSPLDPLIIDWLRFRGGDGTAREILTFLERYHDWPGLSLMRATGEAKLMGASAQLVLRYFEAQAPQTAVGALAFARALSQQKQTRQATAVIQRAWVKLPMTADIQNQIQNEFEQVIAPIHAARLDEMLWQNELDNAERMIPFVSNAEARLGHARLAVRRRAPDVDARIDALSRKLRTHPGLNFDRFLYRYNRRDLRRSAEDLLRKSSQNANSLGRPEAWEPFRLRLGRDALEEGRAQTAYEICANHFILDPQKAAQVEWLAGFTALRALKKAERAIAHFEKYLDGVDTDISRARGYYWLARAQRENRQIAQARASLEKAAQFQTTFYGQLAATEAGVSFDQGLLSRLDAPGLRQNPTIMQSYSFAVGIRLLNDGQHSLGERFLTHLTEGLDQNGQAQLARLALDLNDPHLALRLAKRSASKNVNLPEAYFPLHPLSARPYSVPTALMLAIARRESEFDETAKSSVGALGLMQVMPKTAQHVATQNDLDLGSDPLSGGWRRNVMIGALYLSELAEEFSNNIPLMAAAYNAGPSRARQWIERFGDPRRPGVDPVVWIEQIPFEETRNYIQRVMEGVPIYRARMGGAAYPVPMMQELKARRFF